MGIQENFRAIQNMVSVGDIIVFNEKSKTLHDANDLSVCVNGSAVQITVGDDSISTKILEMSELITASTEAHEALKDILNAAGNEQPYNRDELEENFSGITSKLYDALQKSKGRE